MDKRDYLAEVRAILGGTTSLLPEKAHLEAVDRQLAMMNRNLVVLGEILMSVLDENGVPAMSVPANVIAKVRSASMMPVIQAQPDGSIVVRVMPIGGTPHAPQPTRRM
jgi:hypothetical protein